MSRHTPGPWRVRAPKHDEKYGQLDWDVLSSKGTKVADVNADLPENMCAANASLIAAAPELLTACKAALQRLDEALHGHKPSLHDIKEYGPLLRAAVAKATGGE